MMNHALRIAVRPASGRDRRPIEALLAAARWRHQHLDWENSLDLLHRQPFLLAIDTGSLRACLACPEDPPGVAWLRLFAVHRDHGAAWPWELLWQAARRSLGVRPGTAAVLTQQSWMRTLLEGSGFRETSAVIFLERRGPPPETIRPGNIEVRPVRPDDLEDILAIDQRAFTPLWQHSRSALEAALALADLSTVAVDENSRPVGYALGTFSALGGHLARLAVQPAYQRRGIGAVLTVDSLRRFHERGVPTVSVNTQADNHRGRALYGKLGFRETGQTFPVFELDLQEAPASGTP
ncbi:MAG: GNAT family N-acetyltransferase [Anaerolineales bacterium]